MTPPIGATLPADDEAAVAAAYCAQRVRTYANNLPFAVVGALGVALLFTLLLQDALPTGQLHAWLAAVLASQAIRAGIGLWHHRSPAGRWSDQAWLLRHRLGLVIHGAVWALACQLPLPAGDALAEALRVIVLLGLLGGSFALLAFDLPAALCFGAPVVASLALHLWALQQPLYTVLCWATVGTLLFFSLAARRASQVVHQYVALQAVASRQAEALSHSEARLAERSAELQTTLDSISQGIAKVGPDGRVRVLNRRAIELLDLPPTLDLRGATFDSIHAFQLQRGDLPAGGYIDVHGQVQPLAQTYNASPEVYVRRTHGGQLIEVRSRHLPEGGMVRTFTDVTDYVRTQQALTAAKDEAERANRAKSLFLSGMSHELRTPLNAILGFGEVLQADAHQTLHPAHRRSVAEILNGAQHLLHLINDLLDLAVVESGKLQVSLSAVPLGPLLHSCLALVQPLANSGHIRLQGGAPYEALTGNPASLGLPAGLAGATVRADRTRLTQVLLNLLSNAIKYNRPGGAVQVACTLAAGTVDPSDHRLRITIQDDGPGLDAAQCARLFEPFERLGAGRSAVQGAGLGLALSRTLVRAMGGEIGVHSTPGQGSRFWVELPCGPEGAVAGTPAAGIPAARVPPTAGPAPAHALRPEDTVLYIEDNPVNVLLMEAMLRLLGGPRLVVATRGDEGLQQALALRPRLVLLDIELPDMNGHEVLRRLKAHPDGRHLPVLAVSANAMPEDMARSLAAGCAQYLTKPVSLQQLRSAIDSTLAATTPRASP